MIEVRNLQVRYGERLVADVPELDVGPGECVAIVGESGSGKTTTLMALLGLTEGAHVTGNIRIGGSEDLRSVRGSKAALVMQSPQSALSPTTRLGTLMRRALKRHGIAQTGMNDAVEAVMLDPDILRRYPHEVSGGQAQRFAIALAIALGAEVILADEPTSALDVTVQAEVVGVLRRLREERGLAVLLVSHDLALVSTIADRVLVMKDGQVVESGPAASVLAEPAHPYTRELLEALP
ncbi:ATP-binding cassette domain-containing protein [Nonomuraea sp. NPDC050556]|uniref:ATP-binding cassette domain-containing protein n=1 Tax=Nonomuraea sp. NPDC050556 TaxID=3364369 RepID=UPI0037AAAB2C